MLEKGAIQVVFPLQERFISPLFLVSRKDGEQINDQLKKVELPYFVAATPQTCNEGEGFDDHNRSQSACFCVSMGQNIIS